jgi:hypothetical protein
LERLTVIIVVLQRKRECYSDTYHKEFVPS